MELTTEYLIIVEKTTSEGLYHMCVSKERFNELIQNDPNIFINNRQIKYKNTCEFSYEINNGNVEGKEQRFFQIKVTLNGTEDKIDEYSEMLKTLRGIIHRSGGQLETLKDDVSFHFANKSYPLIHKVESLMRKLITYFMLTNVGKEWVAETSPASVKEAIDKSKRKQYVDVLHQVDFIHLGDFLFKPYQTKDISGFYEIVESAVDIADLNLDELKDFKAKSNWERYFSKVVDCDDSYLNKRWKELYELRCMIAHNAIIKKLDYEKIVQLVDEVSEQLNKAIDNLDKINVPYEEKDRVAENVVSNTNALYGNFIKLWKILQFSLFKIIKNEEDSIRHRPIGALLNELYIGGNIDDEQLKEGRELNHFRNSLIHEVNTSFNDAEIRLNIFRLENLIASLKQSWKDELVSAFMAFDGKATLGEIYAHIETNTTRELSDSWQATIRNIIQTHSSDTDSYKGGDDLFERLETGYWGLRNYKSEPESSENN